MECHCRNCRLQHQGSALDQTSPAQLCSALTPDQILTLAEGVLKSWPDSVLLELGTLFRAGDDHLVAILKTTQLLQSWPLSESCVILEVRAEPHDGATIVSMHYEMPDDCRRVHALERELKEIIARALDVLSHVDRLGTFDRATTSSPATGAAPSSSGLAA
jgi:hypothetical protein